LPFAFNYWGPGSYSTGGVTYQTSNGLVPPPIYLASYVKNFNVFNCPGSPKRLPTSGTVTYGSAFQSYGWNWYITYIPNIAPGTVAVGRTGPQYDGLKLAASRRPPTW